MKYIDKSGRRDEFNEYTVKFLQDCRTPEGRFYPCPSNTECYESFSNRKYKRGVVFPDPAKTGWLQILLDEQDRYCCYCMRRLEEDEVSVEHVVPESLEGFDEREEFGFYAAHADCIDNHVALGSEVAQQAFPTNESVAALTKFPHLIAHSNLTAACMWKKTSGEEIGCCCNNSRQNNRILPFMLMPDVEQHVIYSTDGTLQVLYPNTDNIVVDTIKRLNINNDTLKEIRHIWYLISLTQYNYHYIANLDEVERSALFKTLFLKNSFAEVEERYRKYAHGINSQTPVYWNLLMKYDWYLDYYRP